MKQKIILDTDIGTDIDDALALLYVLKSDSLELKSLTTVYGNVKLRKRLVNRIFESDPICDGIKVHAGEGVPINSWYPVIWYNGLEGRGLLSDEERGDLFENFSSGDGVDFLVDEISSHTGEYNLVTIGALTNIARALQKKPGLERCIKHHYIMGGRLYNLSDKKTSYCFPEHNIACDVEAAQIVLNSKTPKTLIPANLTERTKILREDLEKLYSGDYLQKEIGKLVRAWFEANDRCAGERISYALMHDPLTLIAFTNLEIFKFEQLPICLDKEEALIFIDDNGTQIRVATDFDYDKFKEIFLKTVQKI